MPVYVCPSATREHTAHLKKVNATIASIGPPKSAAPTAKMTVSVVMSRSMYAAGKKDVSEMVSMRPTANFNACETGSIVRISPFHADSRRHMATSASTITMETTSNVSAPSR